MAVSVPPGFDFLLPYLVKLDRAVENNGVINDISTRTGVPRSYIALVGVVTAVAFVFFGLGASLLSQLVGVAYPAYMSFLAIESPDKADDMQWLTYWVVFSVFSLLETVGDSLLFWFPFYYTVKVAFLVYCQAPYTRGAEFIYKSFLRAQFTHYRPTLEAWISRLTGFGTAAAAEMRGANAEAATALAAAAIERGAAGLVHRGAGAAPVDPSRMFGAGGGTGGAGGPVNARGRTD